MISDCNSPSIGHSHRRLAKNVRAAPAPGLPLPGEPGGSHRPGDCQVGETCLVTGGKKSLRITQPLEVTVIYVGKSSLNTFSCNVQLWFGVVTFLFF